MKLGRELKVRYVLEGSVRRSGDRLRVTAQLIDTETGVHVWADRYDREMADVFLVQDEIVSQIVGKIAGNFGVIEIAEGKSATRKSPDEIQAYDLVLRAQDVMRPEWSRETFRTAKEMLRQAIALDPRTRGRTASWPSSLHSAGSSASMRRQCHRRRSPRRRLRRCSSTPPTRAREWWLAPHTFGPSSSTCSSAKPSRRWRSRPMTARSWPLSGA